MSLHPSAGVRILLERGPDAGGTGGGARYAGAIFTPARRFDYTVAIAAGGGVEIAPAAGATGDEGPGARATELLRAIARTVARHALAEEPPAWPRRVLRWRKVD